MPSNTADSPTSWWQVLPAIPESRNSAAYARLRRVWFEAMKPHYALLAAALLAACTPIDVSTAPSGATGDQLTLKTIPAKFQGTWTYKEDGRHPPGGENPTVISATTWTGHESEGQVTSVKVGSENEITVTMAMSGEGETWVDHSRLQLSPDGNILTVVSPPDQSGWTLYRVR